MQPAVMLHTDIFQDGELRRLMEERRRKREEEGVAWPETNTWTLYMHVSGYHKICILQLDHRMHRLRP